MSDTTQTYRTFEDFVIGELGPHALAGGKMSIYDVAQKAWQAALQSRVSGQDKWKLDAEKLAEGIHDAAVRARMITYGTSLTGPQCLMLLEGLAELAERQSASPAPSAGRREMTESEILDAAMAEGVVREEYERDREWCFTYNGLLDFARALLSQAAESAQQAPTTRTEQQPPELFMRDPITTANMLIHEWNETPQDSDEWGNRAVEALNYLASELHKEIVARAAEPVAAQPQDVPADLAYLIEYIPSGPVREEAKRKLAALTAQPVQDKPQEPAFPERDPSKPAEQQGLFRKFDVRRVDGSDQPGGKHYGCRYYVLDLTHDQHAPAAMRTYAAACRQTHPALAADIEAEFGASPAPSASEPDYEHRRAIMEGERNAAADDYFKARWEGLDTIHNRRIFEAGFERGYSAAPVAAQPQAGTIAHTRIPGMSPIGDVFAHAERDAQQEKDAARYRFARDVGCNFVWAVIGAGECRSGLDEAIDARIAALSAQANQGEKA